MSFPFEYCISFFKKSTSQKGISAENSERWRRGSLQTEQEQETQVLSVSA